MRQVIPLLFVLLTTSAAPAQEVLFAPLLMQTVALVDPTLQPKDLYERHRVVLLLRVASVDKETHTAELAVEQVVKGDFVPRSVHLVLAGEQLERVFFMLMGQGKPMVALLGKSRRPNDLIFYLDGGDGGRWQAAEMDAANPARWTWSTDLERELFGVFNGSAARLGELMQERAIGRDWFPATPFIAFGADRLLGRLDGPARGVALRDLDGDGRLDAYACSEVGDRAWLQAADGTFAPAEERLGFAGCRSRSVAAADADADGRDDLLLDDALWLRGADGRYQRSAALPAAAPGSGRVICSCFIDANGDGWPDVAIARERGGVELWLNPGPGGGVFRDGSEAAGLRRPDASAGGSGWLACGDWDGDGRSDLYFSADGGRLLLNSATAGFSVLPLGYDFASPDGGPAGGAACFAPVWRADRQTLVITRDNALCVVSCEEGKAIDQSLYGNELQIAGDHQLPVVAADIDCDGTIDLYVGSRSGGANMPYMNRGYGSFMVSDRYTPGAFPGQAHRAGARGLAAGDVDGDGAPELLLGAPDGRVTLMPNASLTQRDPPENPSAQQSTLAGIRMLSVEVKGPRGVIGAVLSLRAEDGRLLGLQQIGSANASGCCGPDRVGFALREAGRQVLTVRWSDGVEARWPIKADAKNPIAIIATRPPAEPHQGP
ncbi:MAG: VCBS repeat-containing protein [Planctomycetes bacterium]|nr:VCBS repeat-containing protein [Planctomycetota bacterium]